jgi:selenocysteine-specific elongation factor
MNLQGISKEELQRGDVITVPEKIKPAYIVDASLEILKNTDVNKLKTRSLVHFHTGSSELVGRIIIYGKDELKPGDNAYCQFRFKAPVTVMAGDRYIIRKFSPLITIGGGEILDVFPVRRRKEEKLGDLETFDMGGLREKLALKVLLAGLNGVTHADLAGWITSGAPEIKSSISALIKEGLLVQVDTRLIHKEVLDSFHEKVISVLSDFHKENPLKPGMQKEVVRAVFRGLEQRPFEALLALVDDAVSEKELLRMKSFRISLSADKKLVKENILKVLDKAVFQPPSKDELAELVSVNTTEAGELLKIMASEKTLMRINDALYISMNNYTNMMDRLKEFFNKKKEMTVGEFRDVLGTSRKYAIPFLEYLDSNRITLRVGEVRKFLNK